MVPGLLMEWPMKTQRPSKKDILTPKEKKALLASNGGNEAYDLFINIESPPLVAFGPPQDSSGALMSGIVDLVPRMPPDADNVFHVERLEMRLIMEIRTHRPAGHNCPACATRSTVLHTWALIPSRMQLAYNGGARHSFPFSFLIPGCLPATTRSALADISYKLVAEATPVSSTASSYQPPTARPPSPKRIDSSKPVTLTQSLRISRSILPSDEPKHSHRVFPPTGLSASVTLPTIIYPGSMDNAVDVTIQGLNIPDSKLRWSLRKVSWRIDELAKVVSPVCPQHVYKLGCQDRKGIVYEDTRVVGAGHLKNGWKHDEIAGKIDIVLYIGAAPYAKAACHVDAASGVHVSHNLTIECVVTEQMLHTAIGNPKRGGQYQPTGNARVLRMAYPMLLTERGGMGISWDEEIPPRYEDVAWNAPPSFAQAESSQEAGRFDSMEGIEAVDGIRTPGSGSPRPSSSGTSSDASMRA